MYRVVAQLVAHYVRDVGVAGSNPVYPTLQSIACCGAFFVSERFVFIKKSRQLPYPIYGLITDGFSMLGFAIFKAECCRACGRVCRCWSLSPAVRGSARCGLLFLPAG